MDRLSDDKTGLIYANARYLDPDTGRFLSFDPFEGYDNKPISLHRYLYAYQNPTRYVDKDGRCAEPITLTLCVAGAAALAGSAYDYFMTDRREQAYAEVQPASLVGSVLTEGYAFGQSAANTLTGGYFDAARTETVVQHTMENVLPVDAAQRAYGEFTRKDGDLIQGALYTAKALGQTAELGLAFAGAKSPTIAKPKSGVVVESPREVGSVVTKKADYSSIKNPSNVGPGKDFTLRQKQEALELNKAANGGVVRSDASGTTLVKPQKSQRGVTPDPNEWQFDHIVPKNCGGTNCSSNLQILSRQENRIKSDN